MVALDWPADWDLAFYQTLPDFLTIYERCGLTKLKLGEDAIVDLHRFTLEGKDKRGARGSPQGSVR